MKSVLLCGGASDPNLSALMAASARANIRVIDVRTPPTSSPSFCWDLWHDELMIGESAVHVTGAFVRFDVFGELADPRPSITARALGWFQAAYGWTLAHPEIRMFNREMSPIAANKPATLVAARRVGLAVPSTTVTNMPPACAAGRFVAKPVAGGDFCRPLERALNVAELRSGCAAMPAIVQTRLIDPEIRVYVIGADAYAFQMVSNSLDYRELQDVEIQQVDAAALDVVAPLRRLMSSLNMDFGAADFKSDPDDGNLVFLELNNSPMFARFDAASNGELCASMLDRLAA